MSETSEQMPAAAKTLGKRTQSIDDLRVFALANLLLMEQQLEKTYFVASGGAAFAKDRKALGEEQLFEVIKDMTASVELSTSLRSYINKLAALAESKPVAEVAHR